MLQGSKRKVKAEVEEEVEEIDKIRIDISQLTPSYKERLEKEEERFLKRLTLFFQQTRLRTPRLPTVGFKEGAYFHVMTS